jgi:hypothetical protein
VLVVILRSSEPLSCFADWASMKRCEANSKTAQMPRPNQRSLTLHLRSFRHLLLFAQTPNKRRSSLSGSWRIGGNSFDQQVLQQAMQQRSVFLLIAESGRFDAKHRSFLVGITAAITGTAMLLHLPGECAATIWRVQFQRSRQRLAGLSSVLAANGRR